ncbi:MAG: ABC transporter ATP-binding protein [Deltaproteobacteria bacterium]|nr:ABC transporter ATP-binding protein [Deltaproteobacteria bacterium]
MLAIEAKGLTKIYRGLFGKGHQALHGIDLELAAGAAFGLIGPNGAGKTTFIKVMLGVVRPNDGTVRVLGGEPEDPAIRARIGYMPERLHLPASLIPRAFLASVARLKGLSLSSAQLDTAVARVGLADDAHRRIGGFSKGMRQRLGLAAAMLGEPELLILDEPTDGVDPLGRVEIRKLLAEERRRGATLFLNSHLLAETERVCDRVGILHAGRIVRQGALDELLSSKTRYRVRFAEGADEAALTPRGFRREGDHFVIEAQDPAALNAALDGARQSGALIVEVSADRRDLEEVMADAVGTPAAPAAAKQEAA